MNDSVPSKHAGSDLHQIQIGNVGQKQAWWFLHINLLPAQIHLDKTWHCQPEPSRIQVGFSQNDPRCLWKNTTQSEGGKLVVGWLHSAKTRPDDSCTPACFWTRYIWPSDFDQAIQIGSRLVLHKMIRVFFGRTELNWMRKAGSGTYNSAQFWP